jgi:hypothetical protein
MSDWSGKIVPKSSPSLQKHFEIVLNANLLIFCSLASYISMHPHADSHGLVGKENNKRGGADVVASPSWSKNFLVALWLKFFKFK